MPKRSSIKRPTDFNQRAPQIAREAAGAEPKSHCQLACFSGAGFAPALRDAGAPEKNRTPSRSGEALRKEGREGEADRGSAARNR